MDRGAWWATVHGVAKSRTRLKRLSSSSSGLLPKKEALRHEKGRNLLPVPLQGSYPRPPPAVSSSTAAAGSKLFSQHQGAPEALDQSGQESPILPC